MKLLLILYRTFEKPKHKFLLFLQPTYLVVSSNITMVALNKPKTYIEYLQRGIFSTLVLSEGNVSYTNSHIVALGSCCYFLRNRLHKYNKDFERC